MHARKPAAESTPADPGKQFGKPAGGLRARLYTIIFESETRAGRLFDLTLIIVILMSVGAVMLDSVEAISANHGDMLNVFEWTFTLLFTAEYLARLYCVRRPARYATSFFGIIDLLSILPTYLAILLIPGAHVLADVRILRLLRIFRILKLASYVAEYGMLNRALLASRRKILDFPVGGDDDRAADGHPDVPGRRAGQWLHQHPYRGLLGHYCGDHRGFRGHRAQDRSGTGHLLDDDAAGLGHPGGADRHHHFRNERAARRRIVGAAAALR
jgi:hypothetical protein